MSRRSILLFTVPFLSLLPTAAAQSIRAEFFAEPFGRITDIAAPAGDSERVFTCEKPGRIKILNRNTGNTQGTFLSITSLVDDDAEGGLLGLAFHPDYANNGKFYVSYTTGVDDGDSIVSQFTVSAGDPDSADPNSEQVIWGPFPQTSGGHKAGDLDFGPDGMLYFAIGDGDPANGDQDGRAQSLDDPRGKIHRFDVDSPFPHYPADNPFIGTPGAIGSIWALGLRNPWRMTVDQLTGDVYIGDVGQSGKEEIDYLPAGVGGINLGWNCREGSSCFTGGCCNTAGLTDPIHEYNNGSEGCAVVGGVLYRGSQIPEMYGRYIFTDFCTEQIRSFRVQGGALQDLVLHGGVTPANGSWNNLGTWGRDGLGEMYVANHFGGQVFKIVGDCPADVQSYCASTPNSSGSSATIALTGTTSVAAASAELEATGAAQNTPGIFFFGGNQLQAPFGDGFRCVGGHVFRHRPLVSTDATGHAELDLNYDLPQPGATITGGSTWNFQFWFRDPAGPGGTGFNLTDAIQVTFCD